MHLSQIAMADLQIAICVTHVEKFKNEEAISTGESGGWH